MTQTEANEKFKPVEIDFAEVYSLKVQLIWFGFTFATVSPICLLFAMIGIMISFFLQKILYTRYYSIPEYGAPRINS